VQTLLGEEVQHPEQARETRVGFVTHAVSCSSRGQRG
jgi:hypothetical protein